jgi:hypothetical protein
MGVVFPHNFEFSQFPQVLMQQKTKKVDATERKMFYISFYSIAQRNIKKYIFRVDIELCQHGS